MNFSKNFRLQVQTLKISSKNDLVYGLLDVSSKEQFDLTSFIDILTELKREYETAYSKLENLKTDISEQVVKDVIGAKIASEDLFRYISNKMTHLLDKQNIFQKTTSIETEILNRLAKLTRYANDIITQSNYIAELLRNKSIIERLRNTSAARKLINLAFSMALLTSFKGEHLKQFDADKYIKSNAIEIAAPVAKNNEATTYNPLMNNVVKISNDLKNNINIPKAPEGYVYWKTVKAIVTAYNPTGKGLMSGGLGGGGFTSTGVNASKNFDGVAIDPKLIPYGSMAYVETDNKNDTIGWKVADDTGGRIRKNGSKGIYHLDVRMKNYNDAVQFGTKNNVMVHLFKKII